MSGDEGDSYSELFPSPKRTKHIWLFASSAAATVRPNTRKG